MLTQEQQERLRTLVQLYVEELPLPAAVNALLLLYDVCEILGLSSATLEGIFGSELLRLVTGYAYTQAPAPGKKAVALVAGKKAVALVAGKKAVALVAGKKAVAPVAGAGVHPQRYGGTVRANGKRPKV